MLKVFLIIVALLVPISAFAQYEDKAVITYNGKKGYFFAEELGDKILADLLEFKETKEHLVPQLKLEIEQQKQLVVLTEQELKITNDIALKWQETYNKSEDLRSKENDRYIKLLEQDNKWYRNPAIIFIGGVLVGSVVAIGIAFGYGQVK